MNTSPISIKRRKSGMALVIVLGMLVLVVVLIVAFLSSVSTELKSAKSYASGQDSISLAESAANIVISQIQDATAEPQLAWASQPGMIRTYNGSGNIVAAYKLYSSDTFRVTGPFNPETSLSTEVPNDWASDPSRFVDLNKPVSVSGKKHYPILSAKAVGKDASGGAALEGSDPAIEGCYLDTSKAAANTTATQTNPVPMPVRWMYVLKDGKITSTNSTGKVIDATADNPIVGRLAFWTDDETCKVNINTASEGTFWDRPWTRGPYENTLNTSQPMQNEFQRFPGHPAMTSLSVIFPPNGESAKDYNTRIYGITPRIASGGSDSGTVVNALTSIVVPPPVPDGDRLFASVDEFLFNASGSPRNVNKKDAMDSFTDTDIEKVRFFLTASSRAPEVNLFNKPRISLWPLQIDPDPNNSSATRTAKDKLLAFCATMGNTPYYFQRYSTYSFEQNTRPMGTSNWANKQNPIPSSQSPNMDWDNIPRNRQLFAYLQSLTSSPIPGLGGTLSGKYPTTRNQILVEMFDFIRSGVNPQRTLDNDATTGPDKVEYFYAPGYKRSNPAYLNVIGQQQVAPLIIKNGSTYVGKGFGRFPSIMQAVLVFQASDPAEFKQRQPTATTYAVDDNAMDLAPLKMRVVLLLQPFNVTPGFPFLCPNVRYKVRWVDASGSPSPCKVNGVALDFPDPAINLITARDTESNATALGAIEYSYKYYEKPNSNSPDTRSDLPKRLGIPVVGSDTEEEFYPFFTSQISVPGVPGPVPAPPARLPRPTFSFEGGDLEIEIYSGYSQYLDPADKIQTIRMSFPKTPVTLLRPRFQESGSSTLGYTPHIYTDFNERLNRPGLEPAGSHNLKPLFIGRNTTSANPYDHVDTVRSVEALPTGPAKGDLRVFAALPEVPASYFGAGSGYDDPNIGLVHGLRIYPYNLNGNATTLYPGFNKARLGKLVAGVTYYDDTASEEIFGNPIVPNDLAEAVMSNGAPGDWDTGPGAQVDGPYINKPDMGNNGRHTNYFGGGNNATTFFPNEDGATYSPNRQISSGVAFGSLPTGIDPNNALTVHPWQTLLFCKNPAAGSSHPGFGSPATGPGYDEPPDHAFLDFFTMPIAEPYAISEPFSTAGKINMNYQIVPFTYLTRSTGVRAVLKSTLMTAIPTISSVNYKQTTAPDYRYTINPDETEGTLRGFQNRFNNGEIFRSASEICDIYLVPQNLVNTTTPAFGSPKYSNMDSWWNTYKMTGDNVREQPYGHIYPRLTTKSNTYTVHVQTQSLKKVPGTDANVFEETRDQVTGEFRGSYIIERYLDPNSDGLIKANGSPGTETDPDSMVGPYKFRIVSSKRFSP